MYQVAILHKANRISTGLLGDHTIPGSFMPERIHLLNVIIKLILVLLYLSHSLANYVICMYVFLCFDPTHWQRNVISCVELYCDIHLYTKH